MCLKDGRRIIFNLAPLGEIFSTYDDLKPLDFERKFNEAMDSIVEGYSNVNGLETTEMQQSYIWLKHWRNAFKAITWKEVREDA